MSETGSAKGWDQEVDLLIVGSGAGALVAAIAAHDGGAETLLLEKTDKYGGNSAMSGGAMWVPNNRLMREAGVEDSREDAMTYLRSVTEGQIPEEKLETYVDGVLEMIDYVLEKTHLEVDCMLTYTDYYTDAPGGKAGGRSLEPKHFDGGRLGTEFDRLREPALQELVFGRMSMTATEAHHIIARHPGWVALTSKMMARYWFDIGQRMKSKRDRCLSLGNALVAPLLLSAFDRKIPIWLETPMSDLIVEDGRVVGVEAERGGRTIRIRGRQGVLLAAGGFEQNQEMRDEYLPSPAKKEWTAGSPGNTGDAILKGRELGAKVDLMDQAWWVPATIVPGETGARLLVIEKGLPHTIFVNKAGKRFVNEASPYVNIVAAMYENHSEESPCVPAYMIFDANYRKKYPCGPFLQSSQQPDWALPKKFREDYLYKADSLEGLACLLGIDEKGLVETVRAFNENARKGVDPDFRRGEALFDRFYGDENVKPNPCLGPLEKGPYYAILAQPGEMGTKGGLLTDKQGRVVRENGEAIEGLYAVGNSSASVMGPTYAGAGATIGPAMTFGYIVGRDTARAAASPASDADARATA
jgi:3-oxosteroid 1-dehydrogenase